jgi:hypothetical protein
VESQESRAFMICVMMKWLITVTIMNKSLPSETHFIDLEKEVSACSSLSDVRYCLAD